MRSIAPHVVLAALLLVSPPAFAQEETSTPEPTATEQEPSPTPSDTPDQGPTAIDTETPVSTETPLDTETPGDTETPTPSPSRTATPSRTPTPNPTFLACVGNCNGDSAVTVDELVKAVNISLEILPITECFAADPNEDFLVRIDELVSAVSNGLFGCGNRPPTEIPTATVTNTPTPSPSRSPTETTAPTATWSFTPTISRTATATQTITPTPTPIGTPSICGGFVSNVPQLCNVQVEPQVIRLFGTYRVKYCIADLDGNVNELCSGIQTSSSPPPLQCTPIIPPLRVVNECFESVPFASTNPVGDYVFHMQVRDRIGNRTTVQMAAFRVVP